MALNSFKFIVCFAFLFFVMLVVEGIKRASKKQIFGRVQIVVLLIFSYFFLFEINWKFCLCVACVTAIAFFIGAGINKITGHKRKCALFISGITLLILFLGYFKYTGFFVDNLSGIFGFSGITLNIILPIGISFYTFSALSYLIDIYRGKYEPVKNITDFALYISFFPKLAAGPIIRGSEFFPQVREYKGIKSGAFSEGIQIFVFGLFKKMVLADRLGVFVGDVFFAPSAYNTGTVLLAILSYTLQIYFDFSGYSDMAIGSSKILGFDFSRNFNLPYIADGISDFWRRWHISLSSWFMEYLYFPLGGSRKGRARTYLNLMMVMLISGLWHGAGWTFIVWGALFGIACCVERFLKDCNFKIPKILNTAFTFIMVSLFWVVIRADSLQNAFDVFKAAFTLHSGISQPYTWTFFALLCIVCSTVAACVKAKKNDTRDKKGNFYVNGYYPVMNLTKVLPLAIFFIFCGLIIILGYYGDTAFIYGRF